MDWLNSLLENTTWPLLSALILGLMTAISPCPMASNITAIGFISRNIESKKQVFLNGLVYTLGRSISYTLIGILFYFGANQFSFKLFLQTWGERAFGPLLLLIGFLMLGLIKISLPGISKINEKLEEKASSGLWGALVLGVVFALAFCPYSGVLYFGLLIPLTISSSQGLFLPMFFALATGIPVILFSWLLAYSMGELGKAYNKMKIFEYWMRKTVAIIFVITGFYYIATVFFGIQL